MKFLDIRKNVLEAQKTIKNIPGVIKNGKVIAKVGTLVNLPLAFIDNTDNNPRKFFNVTTIISIGNTMKEEGDVDQPLGVIYSDNGKGTVTIVWGERRWRGAHYAGILSLSCIIIPKDTSARYEMKSLRENLGKEDMSSVEQALEVEKQMDKRGWDEQRMADEIGVKKHVISHLLKYLKLHPIIQNLVIQRKLEKGMALQLISYTHKNQIKVLQAIRDEVEKRGRPIHPNEASRIAKRATEILGIPRNVEGHRGRKHKTYSELAFSNLAKKAKDFETSLEEVLSISLEQLREVKSVDFITLEKTIEAIQSMSDKMTDKLSHLD